MSKAKHTPDGVIHMLVDTCVWLDLAKQADGGKMVAMLRELCDKGRIELIVPQVVLDEFERNRDRVQEAMTRSVSARFREVRKAIDEHGRGDGRQKALDELDNITHQVPLVNELATQTFDALLDLLHLGKTIKHTPKMEERVVARALTKRAPLHREKHTLAEALTIERNGTPARTPPRASAS